MGFSLTQKTGKGWPQLSEVNLHTARSRIPSLELGPDDLSHDGALPVIIQLLDWDFRIFPYKPAIFGDPPI